MTTLSRSLFRILGGLALAGGMVISDVSPVMAVGLPQLDHTTFASQILWLVLSFFVLYILMSKVALPRIGGVFEDRKSRINGTLDKAAQFKEEADKAAAAYEASLKEAREEAHGILKTSREEIAKGEHEKHTRLAAELSERLSKAEHDIKAAKAQALGRVESYSGEVVEASIRKLLASTPDREMIAKVVKAVVEEQSK